MNGRTAWNQVLFPITVVGITLFSTEAYAEKIDIRGVRLGMSVQDAETATKGRCKDAISGPDGRLRECILTQDESYTLAFTRYLDPNVTEEVQYKFCSGDRVEKVVSSIADAYGASYRMAGLTMQGTFGDHYVIYLLTAGPCAGGNTYILTIYDKDDIALDRNAKAQKVQENARPTPKF